MTENQIQDQSDKEHVTAWLQSTIEAEMLTLLNSTAPVNKTWVEVEDGVFSFLKRHSDAYLASEAGKAWLASTYTVSLGEDSLTEADRKARKTVPIQVTWHRREY